MLDEKIIEEAKKLVDRLKNAGEQVHHPINLSLDSKINRPNQEVTMPIQKGRSAPAFSLPDANGKKVALKDFKGKNVIVYFYPKDDTPG